MDIWFKLHLFSCLFMTGLIWLVQIVQYPGFLLISEKDFQKFHQKHSDRISYIVAPVMLIELLSSYFLWKYAPTTDVIYLYYFVSTIFIFAATAFESVPQHNKLEAGKDDKVIRRLIAGNSVRTLLWTSKAVVLFVSL